MKSEIKDVLQKGIKWGLSLGALASVTFFPGHVANATSKETNSHPSHMTTTKGKVHKEVPYRNVMYYGDWSIWGGQENYYPKDIPANLYTHLNYAFLAFDGNGNLQLTDKDAAFGADVASGNGWDTALSGCIPALNALREQHPNMKIGVSLGGWSKSGHFSEVAADDTKRTHFVQNVMKFIKYTGMDFVDVDWEYPTNVRQPDKVDNKGDEGTPNANPADRENYIKLMQDLRTGLDHLGQQEQKKYELSTALPGSVKQLKDFIDVEKLFSTVDFVNLMTYDLSGAFEEHSGHQTALYDNPKDPKGHSIQAAVNYLKEKKVDMTKIDVGAAMYSRGWQTVNKGDDPLHPGLFQPAALTNKDADGTPSRGAINELPLVSGDGGRAGGVWSYRHLGELQQNDVSLHEYWDEVAQAPYMYSDVSKNFYTYDNVRSVQAKADFVKKNHLGGMISWMASQDKSNDGSASRKELSEAMKKELYGDQAIPVTTENQQDQLAVNMNIHVASLDSGQKGLEMEIQNQQSQVEQGALELANRYFSTIKKAKLIITMKDGSTFTGGDWKAGKVSSSDHKTYVDLSSVWDAKLIKPNTSYSFKLTPSKEMKVDPSNVQKIQLEQYYSPGVKISSQTIYEYRS